jgi:cold shock CspA family protein
MLKTGTIKYYDPKKGFGFLREKETHTEIFFHKKGTRYDAKEFDVVTFDTKRTPSGVKAFNIRLKQEQRKS